MQFNTKNREAYSLDEDCCVVTREGAGHRWRHRSLCGNDVVRSTEPNRALKERSKSTAHKTRKQAYLFCWKLPVPLSKSWLCYWPLLKNSTHLLLPHIILNSHVKTRFIFTDKQAVVSFLQDMAKRNNWQLESFSVPNVSNWRHIPNGYQ
jgi:hypothetical protein